MKYYASYALATALLLVLSSCGPKQLPKTKKPQLENQQEVDFEVKNKTGKKLYIVCFSYIKENDFARWHWDKSKIYTLAPDQTVVVDVDTVADKIDRERCFGYLGVFTTEQEAEESIYERLDSKSSIDLDLLFKLKNKKVIIGVEQYGFKGAKLDSKFILIGGKKKAIPELDFVVENKTSHPVYVTCFVYQKKNNDSIWYFDKTPVVYLEPGKQTLIDVDTIVTHYDRTYLSGHLAVFNEEEKETAHQSTYELLEPRHKVKLGNFTLLKGKKISLQEETYGIMGSHIDYQIKPVRWINFNKAHHKKISKK